MNLDQQRTIIEKSRDKKDGIYNYQNITYRVLDRKLKYICLPTGDILQFCYGFNVVIGNCKDPNYKECRVKALKNLDK